MEVFAKIFNTTKSQILVTKDSDDESYQVKLVIYIDGMCVSAAIGAKTQATRDEIFDKLDQQSAVETANMCFESIIQERLISAPVESVTPCSLNKDDNYCMKEEGDYCPSDECQGIVASIHDDSNEYRERYDNSAD